MADVSILYFTKNCSRLLKQVSRTREALRIARSGSVLAEIIPVPSVRKRFVLGDMVGTTEIVGDIVSSAVSLNEVGVNRSRSSRTIR